MDHAEVAAEAVVDEEVLVHPVEGGPLHPVHPAAAFVQPQVASAMTCGFKFTMRSWGQWRAVMPEHISTI